MPKKQSVKRQAVVIIHGIGEQRPMSTLRSFAEVIPKVEKNPSGGVTWSKPDSISEGFEHHRYTITQTRTRPVTDVYELYWAHLFEQSNPSTFLAWAGKLLFRPLPKLPRRYQVVSFILWLLLLFASAGAIWILKPSLSENWLVLASIGPVWALIYVAVMYLANSFFLGTISDAARYLDANPRNVEARNNVRELGISFLERLHSNERKYDRIIVCGHSLGTVIGYDILRHLWYRTHEGYDHPETLNQEVQKRMSRLAEQRDGKTARGLQRDLWLEQKDMGNKWRITDFITMGSPLAHADILMADTNDDFLRLLNSGELPACPPFVDPITKSIGFKRSYKIADGKQRTINLLRHSSMFAVTRWTNIFFKTKFGLFGDPIGGEIAPIFGPAIRDHEIQPKGWQRLFAHLSYWSGERQQNDKGVIPFTALDALGDALDIDQKSIKPSDDLDS